jgi:hypothetical protein
MYSASFKPGNPVCPLQKIKELARDSDRNVQHSEVFRLIEKILGLAKNVLCYLGF